MVNNTSLVTAATEKWKPVLGYENNYEVSDIASVRNVSTGKILKPRLMPNGYHSVSLCVSGKCTRYTLHRIVCEAFLGERPYGHEINHKDGNKINNNLSNLEYLTPKENMHHAIHTLKIQHVRGERVHTAKLTEKQVREIMGSLKNGGSTRRLAEAYGVAVRTIRAIKSGRNWSYLFDKEENQNVEDDIEKLKARISQLESALEPFAEAWLQVPFGVDSALYIRQTIHDGEIKTASLGLDTSTLEDAHTAWAGLEPTPTKQASEGKGGK